MHPSLTDDEPKARGVPREAAIPMKAPVAMLAAAHNNPGAQVPTLQFPPPRAAEVPIDLIELSDRRSTTEAWEARRKKYKEGVEGVPTRG